MKKYILLALIFVALGTVVWWTQSVKPSGSDTTSAAVIETDKSDFSYVQINNVKIPVEIARTEAETQRGLSGRESLDTDKGMLFIFPKPDYYRFWMPDMNFPIDIIWINENRVVGISQNISNEFDSKNPKFYAPPQPVDRVLEVNAGFAQKENIKVGDPFNFVQGRPE